MAHGPMIHCSKCFWQPVQLDTQSDTESARNGIKRLENLDSRVAQPLTQALGRNGF
jgi:hypothetical protein